MADRKITDLIAQTSLTGTDLFVIVRSGANYKITAANVITSVLADHLADTADAHDASAISVLDTANNFTGTDVESALAELGGQRPRVAATIAALPDTPADGAQALLRVASSGDTPAFEYVPLVYDGTSARWVSEPQLILNQGGSDLGSGTATTYADISGNDQMSRGRLVPTFKGLWDAGLRPQVFLSSWMNYGTVAETLFLQAAVTSITEGDASGSFQANHLTGGEISVTGTTDTFRRSGWKDMAGTAPTRDHGLVHLQQKASGGATPGVFRATSLSLRWVAAAA